MTFPAVVTVTQGTQTNPALSVLTITCPTIAAGDLMLVAAAMRYGFGTTPLTRPSGWSSLHTPGATSNGELRMDYKIADGSESASSLVFSGAPAGNSYFAWQFFRISGGGTPAKAGADHNVLSFPNLTAPGGAADNLWLVIASDPTGQTPNAVTGPTGFSSNVGYIDTGGFEDIGLWRAFRSVNAASQTSLSHTISGGGDFGSLLTVVIPPPSAAVGARSQGIIIA